MMIVLFSGMSKCGLHDAIVTSGENKNKHTLYNNDKKEVYKYHIDGDIIKDKTTRRCDYMVEVETSNGPTVFVIELKGSDLKKAIEQIESTISIFKTELKGYNIFPRVVIHRISTHDISSSEYRDFKKKYPNFKKGTLLLEDTI